MIIVDYNVGNIGSILNMFKKIGVKACLSSNEKEIMDAERILLPGVGAFDNGMHHLNNSGLVPVLNHKAMVEKTPIIGICLGMQLLLNESEEGKSRGLGWIDGACKKFDPKIIEQGLKVPHMGWNLASVKKQNPLFKNMEDEARFYFVHSYHATCSNDEDILATTHHGYDFVSSINRGNIYGVQFHPEKSHKFGMALLKNFMECT